MKLELDVIIEEVAWRSVQSLCKRSIARIFKVALSHFSAFRDSTVEIALLLTNDAKMQKLNLEFLNKDKPTDVLSFPDRVLDKNNLPCVEHIYIGDIALGFAIIEREAREKNINFYDHIAHLIIYGTLHLLGYDHVFKKEAKEMQELEIRLLQDLNIISPYRAM